ncbi:hypothetical protein KCP71_22880 [Salmonella enterica subsp. enterica]|nr:hypothetical protein KCP71_22880 [Salmonella enterica subsp. enterica]
MPSADLSLTQPAGITSQRVPSVLTSGEFIDESVDRGDGKSVIKGSLITGDG